jgi:hypothetical protein
MLAFPASATLGTRASRPPFRLREKKPTPLSSRLAGEGELQGAPPCDPSPTQWERGWG